jgi:peptidoglycan/xylan/chitin deacetylase (PgdA/CDA1 family)
MYDSATRILSIDVDDLIVGTADYYGEPVPAGHRSTIEHDVRTTLDVLARCDARATFFVNTQYCILFPAMLKEIHDRGHMLASHGDRHRNVADLSLPEFERDLCRSLELLARVQPRVLGYRPPAFSMPYDDAHLNILKTHGVRYVSSGVGVARSNAPRWMRPAPLPSGVTHVPISTAYLLGGRVKYPIGYGAVARLCPERLYLATLRRWLARDSYFHYYCHTFEFGGIPRGTRIGNRRLAATLSTRVYMLRCWKRQGLLEAILRSASFSPIETALFSE